MSFVPIERPSQRSSRQSSTGLVIAVRAVVVLDVQRDNQSEQDQEGEQYEQLGVDANRESPFSGFELIDLVE